jgi:hypothetical protein
MALYGQFEGLRLRNILTNAASWGKEIGRVETPRKMRKRT